MSRGRLLIAVVMAVIALVGYFGYTEFNPVTGEKQHVSLSREQEVALGLKAAPEMAARHGGLSRDPEARTRVETVGQRLVAQSAAKDSRPYAFRFHLLADPTTINAFALPGGQVFITTGLYRKLGTAGELAAVLGHEVAHVVARHGAEHLAKAQLTQGLAGAAVIATYDPNNPSSAQAAAVAQAIAQLVNMKFGRDDELESDALGVRFMAEARYDPRAMIRVMEILAAAASGQGRPPEFFSTHPNPDRRIERIRAAIAQQFPEGVPPGLDR